jgi:hypothetical protein
MLLVMHVIDKPPISPSIFSSILLTGGWPLAASSSIDPEESELLRWALREGDAS